MPRGSISIMYETGEPNGSCEQQQGGHPSRGQGRGSEGAGLGKWVVFQLLTWGRGYREEPSL